MSSNEAMRRETFFSGDSPYEVLVRGNVLLHRQAAQQLVGRLRTVLDARPVGTPIRVLDLACGGDPSTVATAMATFVDHRFHYTGIDINNDQVEKARRFVFADNVEPEILQGSGWDLRWLSTRDRFDLVFVGLNWHHGTPQELWFLVNQVHLLLAGDGRLVNHDCYRPDDTLHVARPETVEEDGQRSAGALVEPSLLAAAGVPQLHVEALPVGTPTAWRSDMIARLERGYLASGGNAMGARILTGHASRRDFPVSVSDARRILGAAGFEVEVHRYDLADGPMAEYLAMLTARPMRHALPPEARPRRADPPV